jgi:tetratricopeptide (TPR) repeat protein
VYNIYVDGLADRKEEIALLRKHLQDSDEGKGRVVFISGELGMGKSALCDAISKDAVSRGFQVLRGWCYPEYMRPYLPFENALKPLKMDYLFQTSSPPRIEHLFLIAKSGILMTSAGKEEGMDGDIFTSMLTAVGHFVRDSMQMLGDENGSLDVLGYGGMRILIEKGELCSIAAVISGKENEYLIEDLKSALERIHQEYAGTLKSWDNDIEKMAGAGQILQSIMDSGKYEGIEYGEGDPKLIKGNIMENVTLGLMRHSKTRPVLLIIEDIHWADASTLSLIHYMARNIRKSRIMVVCTYRSEEEKNLEETMNSMMVESLMDHLALGPIDMDTLEKFLVEHLNDEEVAKRIAEESGGNPLFAVEMLNSILNGGGYEIPRKIKDIVRSKVEKMSKDERDVAEAAAVLGEDFGPSIIARMLDMKRIEVIKALKSMKRRGIVDESDGKYRFRTPKFREILYSEMGRDLTEAYHELAAESLENYAGSNEALGYHYFMAGIYEKAIPHLMKSAEEAMKKYSNEEAKRHLLYVLDATEEGGWPEERAKALKYMGEILVREGEYEKAIESFEKAMEIQPENSTEIMGKIAEAYTQMGDYNRALKTIEMAMKMADKKNMGKILRIKGSVLYRKGEYDDAMKVLEEALDILGENGEDQEVGSVIRAIGNIYFARGEYDRAMDYYKRALSWPNEGLSGKAMSLNNMGVIEVKLGNYEKAAEDFREALKIRERVGDQWGIAMFLSNLGVVHSESGDYKTAMDYFQRSLKIRRKIGDRWGEAMSLNNIGMLNLDMGEYLKAIEYFREALKIRESIGDKGGKAASLNTTGMAYAELGEKEKALEMYERALEIEEELGDKGGIAESLSGMGKVYALSGNYNDAIYHIDKSIDICEETDDRRMMAHNLCLLSEVHMEMGIDVDEEMQELDILVRELNSNEILAWYLRIKGVKEHKNGNEKKAMKLLGESLKIFEDMGRMGDVGKTLYWMGVVEGKEKGREHMERAMEIFKRSAMQIWESKAKEFL